MNIAIVGATGNVGRKILEVLARKKLPIKELFLVASPRSAGQKINFNGKEHEVFNLETFNFSKIQITFFAAGGKISEQYALKAAKYSAVIDNSSFFRMDPDVPLIVPQVNPEAIKSMKKNIIANPNCSTAQLVIALKPLHDLFNIERIVVSTYQSVSGAGKVAMDDCVSETLFLLGAKDNHTVGNEFPAPIAFNAIPQIDAFSDDGYTKEELKMTNETKKILDQKIELTATCVRIPVLVSHSESVNIEFKKPFSIAKVREALSKADGCKVYDSREDGGYSTPLEAEGKNETYISRIREDKTNENCLNLWIVSDNLLRGAALNAVEIAETLIKINIDGK